MKVAINNDDDRNLVVLVEYLNSRMRVFSSHIPKRKPLRPRNAGFFEDAQTRSLMRQKSRAKHP